MSSIVSSIRERLQKREEVTIAEATSESADGFLDLIYHGGVGSDNGRLVTYRQLRKEDPEAFGALSRSKGPIAEHVLRYLLLEDSTFEDADETLVLPFGKHKGKTVAELLVEDPRYLYWVAGEEPVSYFDRQLRAVMDRLPSHDEIMPFGKYKDRLFSQAMLDFDYTVYWSEKQDLTGVMARFVKYVNDNC